MIEPFSSRSRTEIVRKDSQLCLGLDLDPSRPSPLHNSSLSSMRAAASQIIEATVNLVWGYKLNLAFFERHGSEGYRWLEDLREQIGDRAMTIGDGKRGDIGSSAARYAEALLGHLNFDAVTLSPYMGRDSIEPFIGDPARGAFILCLTSNTGSLDFQRTPIGDPLYLRVARWAQDHNSAGNLGLVVGATHPGDLLPIRDVAPDLPFLVPGIGVQGGDLAAALAVSRHEAPVIITASRGILYNAGGEIDDIVAAVGQMNSEITTSLP